MTPEQARQIKSDIEKEIEKGYLNPYIYFLLGVWGFFFFILLVIVGLILID